MEIEKIEKIQFAKQDFSKKQGISPKFDTHASPYFKQTDEK